jgi:hypothetical protein
MLSINEATALGPVRSHPERGWSAVDTDDVHYIAELICRYSWCPATFKTDHRVDVDFVCADFIGLDFDEGFSLDDAHDEFKDYTHVIGTTHSHQVWKKEHPPADRFRVLLKLERRCDDGQAFRATMENLVATYPVDSNTINESRLYYRCKDIVSVNDSGLTLPIECPRPPRKYAPPPSRGSKIVPPFVRSRLTTFVPRGRRTRGLCWQVSMDLFKAGYTVDEIEGLLSNSKTYRVDGLDADARTKLRDAIRSAAKRNGIDIPKTYWRAEK